MRVNAINVKLHVLTSISRYVPKIVLARKKLGQISVNSRVTIADIQTTVSSKILEYVEILKCNSSSFFLDSVHFAVQRRVSAELFEALPEEYFTSLWQRQERKYKNLQQ